MGENTNTGNQPIGDGVRIDEPVFRPDGSSWQPADAGLPEIEDLDDEKAAADGDNAETDGDAKAHEAEGQDDQDRSEAKSVRDASDVDEGAEAEEEAEDGAELGSVLDDEALEKTFVEIDGEQVPLVELKKGYLRQSDYTRKTQELAEQRRELGTQAEEVQKLLTGMALVLQQSLPPEPDPSLANNNPEEYLRQKAAYDAAVQNIQQLVQMAEQAQEVTLSATQPDPEAEAERLLERVPELRDPKLQEKWFAEAETAARQLGFSDEEIENVADHRLWLLAHYAAIGMRAEGLRDEMKAEKNKLKPSARKPRGKARKDTQRKLQRNRAALERLRRTGSLSDALAIDFELPE